LCGWETTSVNQRYDHDWGEWELVAAATCEEDGEEERVCKHNPLHTQSNTLEAFGHDPVSYGSLEPTCTEDGYTDLVICDTCGEVLEGEYIPALEHAWGELVTVLPTCTTTGSEIRICENDETHIDYKELPAAGHTEGPGIVMKEATHTEDGAMNYYCTKCEVLLRTAIIPKIPFSVIFLDWDGDILDEQYVAFGEDAAAPDDPARETYAFIGWDTDFTNVTGDLTVTALYERLCSKWNLS
jgi:hypothetical protein